MRNTNRWILSTLAFLLLATPALPGGRQPADAGPERLLPAESTVTVAVSSLAELESDWARLAAALELAPGTDLNSLMLEHAPALAAALDPARTYAASFRIYPVMFQRETAWTYVLPLLRDAVDPAALVDAQDVATTTVRDGYLTLSNVPDLETVAAAPAWWHDMLPGVVAAHMDLGALIEENRGMVEMSLAALPMQAEQARLQAEAQGGGAPAAAMPSAEQMEGVASLARLIMDSLTGLDAAADVDGERVVLRTRFDVQPGSPLATGPQPDFASALELTRRLPRHADVVAVSAFDQSRTLDQLRGFTRASLRQSFGDLAPDEESLEQWLDSYEELSDLTNHPYAFTLSDQGERFAMRWVQHCGNNAGATASRILGMLEMTEAMGLGRYEYLGDETAAGSTVHVLRLDYELPQDAPENADEIMAMLDLFSGEIRLAVQDQLMLMSMNEDADAMVEMLRGGGRPHDRIAALARDADPDVRQVVAGDYAPFLSMMTAVTGAEATVGPLPFTGVFTATGTRSAFDVATTLDGVKSFAAFMEAMEAAH